MATDALAQGEYFYKKMEETLRIPIEFRYNVNAFITTARSITWVLQKQYKGNVKFESWYAGKQNEMKNDELMVFFNEARKVSVKEHPVQPATSAYIRHLEIHGSPKGMENAGFAITSEGEAVWVTKDEEGKEKRIHASEFDEEIARQYYFECPEPPQTFQKLQVIDLCGLYLMALRDLVKDALEIVQK